jgi:hypothetical protein
MKWVPLLLLFPLYIVVESSSSGLSSGGGGLLPLLLETAAADGGSRTIGSRDSYGSGFAAQSTARQPNLVVFFADNLGYGDVGALGAPATRTPHIDSLARDGMTLKHWVSAASMCSPSRAALLTGRYHMRSGIFPLTMPSDAVDGLPLNETTLAEHLSRAGWATMAVGKW